MPTIRLRFPGGRYHATAWGHHVNEGHIEWPPSPWRILRALIACGFTKQRWSDIPAPAGRLIEKLAGKFPLYRLPTGCAAHSRHYMPIGSLEKGREKTTLVIDTWADVGDGTLDIFWDCDLADDEDQAFRQLTKSLGYLGRSESWVEAELVGDAAQSPDGFNALPHREGVRPDRQWEQISLMAAIPPKEYESWRRSATEKVLAEFPLPEGKKKSSAKLMKDRATATAPYPETLLDCLTKDTAWWKRYRWSQPPGSQQVLYWRRCNLLEVSVPQVVRPSVAPPVTMMLLALTTSSGNRSALPMCRRTLPQAELFHQAIISHLAKGRIVDCPELTGLDEQGRPLHGHKHSHILPLDLDGDGHLDHIIIHAPMGLRVLAQRAIRALRRTWTKGGVGELQVALAGSGDLDALRRLTLLDRRTEELLGPPDGARVWISMTPFVPPRYLKLRGRNTLAGQVNGELASRGLPPAERVEVLPISTDTLTFRHFVRCRKHGGMPPPVDLGFALRLQFSQPINGPLTLGYASHFGLGLFVSTAGSEGG